MRSIFETVKKVIVEQLGVDSSEVKAESHLINDLGADELDRIELVLALEEELDVEIDDEAADRWETVGDAVKALEAKLPKEPATARAEGTI